MNILFIHADIGGWLDCFHLWLLYKCFSEHLCTSFCLDIYFQFLGFHFVWSYSDSMNNIKPIEKLSESVF